MTTKGGTMTAEELAQIRKRHQGKFDRYNTALTATQCDVDRAHLLHEVDRLTAELETLRKVTETGSYTAEVELHLAEEAKSMALIIGLKDELAKARGRCEVCGWRWHWDFDPEQGTGEQP